MVINSKKEDVPVKLLREGRKSHKNERLGPERFPLIKFHYL